MKVLPIAAMVTVGFLSFSFPATAATIRVPDEQPTIQSGIDAASYGDTVLVECGTYYEHDIVMKSGVYLTSETGQADCVTVDAQQLGRVFFGSAVDSLASIEGFTVTGGSAASGGGMLFNSSSLLTIKACMFTGNQAESSGGGLHCISSLTLTSCTFVGNTAGLFGGGLSCSAGGSPTLTSCTFVGNGAIPTGKGGGMYCYYSSPTLTSCTFSGNQARDGGGLSSSHSSPTLTSCTFAGNSVDSFGGGMHCSANSSSTLTGCTFSENQAGDGGGMFCWEGSPSVLTGCIIALSQEGEAVYCDGTSSAVLSCCDVYGNAGGDWVDCIADQYGVNGNISEDPLFCGDLNPDEPYTLHASSPCAPDNNPECGLIGAWEVGCGLTPVQAASWGAIKAMYR